MGGCRRRSLPSIATDDLIGCDRTLMPTRSTSCAGLLVVRSWSIKMTLPKSAITSGLRPSADGPTSPSPVPRQHCSGCFLNRAVVNNLYGRTRRPCKPRAGIPKQTLPGVRPPYRRPFGRWLSFQTPPFSVTIKRHRCSLSALRSTYLKDQRCFKSRNRRHIPGSRDADHHHGVLIMCMRWETRESHQRCQ